MLLSYAEGIGHYFCCCCCCCSSSSSFSSDTTPNQVSNKTFLLYSLNIRPLLNPKNSTALTDLASSSHPPDLIALQETKISSSSTDAHISYSKPPGYSLHSFPRITPSSKSPEISGGGSAFLVREPAIVLNSSRH